MTETTDTETWTKIDLAGLDELEQANIAERKTIRAEMHAALDAKLDAVEADQRLHIEMARRALASTH